MDHTTNTLTHPTANNQTKNNQTSLALSPPQLLSIVAFCLGLGVFANWLLQGFAVGLNVSLMSTVMVVGLIVLARYAKLDLGLNPVLLSCLLIFGMLFSWRDSSFLQALNIFVQGLLFCLIAARATQPHLRQTNFAEGIFNLVITTFGFIISPLQFLWRVPWQKLRRQSTLSKQPAVAASIRGVLIALPLLVIFTGLFVSADARFQALLNPLLQWDIGELLEHIIFSIIYAGLTFAFLSQTLLARPWQQLDPKPPSSLRLGNIETALVYGSLVLLFSTFIAVQASYLFAGESAVLTSELSYANYGRRGFFELVTVTFLLHIVLLVGMWTSQAKRLYRTLASVLVGLLYAVIVSAFIRLNLYIQVYGLTELRYYSSAMILWIAGLMVLFLLRLHSSREPKLAYSYFMFGMLGVVGLYISNPDARIANINLARAQAGLSLDVGYFYQLSADAAPSVLEYYEASTGDDEVQDQLAPLIEWYVRQDLNDNDWRAWNWGRWRRSRRLAASLDIYSLDGTNRGGELPGNTRNITGSSSSSASGWIFD
ncbi:MAG: DUF4173 domain-containing protein [Deinococcota bacterium]